MAVTRSGGPRCRSHLAASKTPRVTEIDEVARDRDVVELPLKNIARKDIENVAAMY